MANTRLGLTGPVWGTVGDTDILVESITESTDGDWEELQNGDGDIVAAVAYGDRVEFSLEVTMKNSTGLHSSYLVDRGSTITLPADESEMNKDSLDLYVQSKEKARNKGAWLTASLTAIGFPDMS